MTEILLCSEKFIKSVTSVSDNLAGKYILPSLREAQEIALRNILGDCLLERLKEIGAARAWDDDGNTAYKALLEKAQYFLAYTTICEAANRVSYKVGNFGVAKSQDENLQVATQDEIAKQVYFYRSKADYHQLLLQHWLLDNRAAFPELGDCACAKIRSNLRSAASCGIWLGGARGKGPVTKEGAK
ncbi:MAG: hypothetical protein IJ654_05320 [Bacteroidales bacterium]|nr:hypothetical protein [Bacteroidales bacterium]